MYSSNIEHENIIFILDELETQNSSNVDINFTKSDSNNKLYPHFLNYSLNYNVKQLLLICDYYKIEIKNKKKMK